MSAVCGKEKPTSGLNKYNSGRKYKLKMAMESNQIK